MSSVRANGRSLLTIDDISDRSISILRLQRRLLQAFSKERRIHAIFSGGEKRHFP